TPAGDAGSRAAPAARPAPTRPRRPDPCAPGLPVHGRRGLAEVPGPDAAAAPGAGPEPDRRLDAGHARDGAGRDGDLAGDAARPEPDAPRAGQRRPARLPGGHAQVGGVLPGRPEPRRAPGPARAPKRGAGVAPPE